MSSKSSQRVIGDSSHPVDTGPLPTECLACDGAIPTTDGQPIDRPIPHHDFTIDPPDDPNRLAGRLGDHLDINACFDALGYTREEHHHFSAEKPADAEATA